MAGIEETTAIVVMPPVAVSIPGCVWLPRATVVDVVPVGRWASASVPLVTSAAEWVCVSGCRASDSLASVVMTAVPEIALGDIPVAGA